MIEQGWIKLHRKMLDNPVVWKDSDHLAVWIYLLLNATHKDMDVLFKNKRITLKPGQLITGRKSIAKKLDISESKDEIYLSMLKSYGQSSVVSVVEEAAEMFMASVKYREEVGRAELNGKKFVHVKVYKGSSDFDSREMAILIDGIISEAEKLGISTITPAEAERMKGAWGNG